MMAAASLTALAGVSRCGLAVRTGARGQTDRGGEAEEWSTMQAKQGCVLTLIQNVAVAVMWPLCAVAGDKQLAAIVTKTMLSVPMRNINKVHAVT